MGVMSQRVAFIHTKLFALLAAVVAGALYWFVLVKISWQADDYWIGNRQIEQFFAGNGFRWNPHERVQLFTSILDFFLRVFVRALTEDYFWINAIKVIFFNALTLVLLHRLLKSIRKWAVAVLLLVASNSYMDHAWSGMENHVGYALLVGFLLCWQAVFAPEQTPAMQRRALLRLFAFASIAPFFRHDSISMIWIPTLSTLWFLRHLLSVKHFIILLLVIGTPIGLWSLFATYYFGFPFPLTAYFKLGGGLDRITIIYNGLYYYRFTLVNDAPTLVLIFFAVGWLLFRGKLQDRLLAAGMVLYALYILNSGADYMGGRFISYLYILAVAVLMARWDAIAALLVASKSSNKKRKTKKMGAGLRAAIASTPFSLGAFALVWMVFLPHTPLNSAWVHHKADPTTVGGISDERAAYHKGSSIGDYIAYLKDEVDIYPNHPSARLGKNVLARIDVPVLHVCDMGMAPFFGRLEQKMIDVYGYSDPLQARLPGLNPRPSHMIRRLPAGYLESVANDDARLHDKPLNEFYTRLRRVTQEPLEFSWQRFADIWYVNFNFPKVQKGGYPTSLPLLCYAKHDANLLQQLETNPAQFSMEVLNKSDLSS